MSTSGYLINVPKLKGRENYDDWAFATSNFLLLEGIDIENVPATLSETEMKKAKAKLVMTIDSSLYVHIKCEITVVDVWAKLKRLFDDTGYQRKISLLRTLISIRLENCDTMTTYVSQMVETAQKLKGTGFEITDEWIGSLLLAGLPDKFSPMIMAIEHSGIAISADVIKTKLLDMCDEVGTHGTNSAFWTKQRTKVGSTNRAAKSKCQTSTSTGIKQIKCYNCKKVGHYKSMCPSLKENKSVNAFSAAFFNGSTEDWYVDSGASAHMTCNPKCLVKTRNSHENKEIVVANQATVCVESVGDTKITTIVNSSQYDVIVKNVLYIPKLTINLLSVSQLLANGNRVVFKKQVCFIYNEGNKLIGIANLINGVYKLNTIKSENLLSAMSIWHRRLGHINSKSLQKMKEGAVEGVSYDKKADIKIQNCEVCCEGKQTRFPFPSDSHRSEKLLEVVHSDLCGPMETKSIGQSKYFLLFVDDASRMTFVYFLKEKNQVYQHFKEYQGIVENQTGNKIKILRTDNGGEFCSREMENFLLQAGIVHQKTNPHTPEQNGLAERFNRTVVERARCLLFEANLNKSFWAEAVNTAVYLKNRTPAASLGMMTPFERWTGRKPNLSHIRIFGSVVMMHIPKIQRRKWDKKADKLILVGYPENIKGYRLYNPKSKKITTSRDVIIMEKDSSDAAQIVVNNEIEKSENKENSESEESSSEDTVIDANDPTYICNSSSSQDVSYQSASEAENESITEKVDLSEEVTRRKRKPVEKYGISNLCILDNIVSCGEELSYEEAYDDAVGLSLCEALKGPEKEQWRMAMREELQCFKENDAWELCDTPKDSKVVQCKWVLRKKYDSDDKVRFRARLVAKGFSQVEGVDYTDTFSPVVRHTTLRLLFALSVQLSLDIEHLDVTTAFLNGTLEETIFMQIPVGFSDLKHSGQVLKLKKAIYGLKQSSRAWYKKVDECLIKNGYFKSKYEPCMFLKRLNKLIVIVTLYVDDFFIFSNHPEETQSLKDILASNFKIKDLGEIKKCLGVNVNVDKCNKTISLNQKDYIDKVLHKFNMNDCKTVQTPMETKLHVSKNDSYVGNFPYQQIIGCLMYLAVLTRPDIAFAVGYLSQFNNSHTTEHCVYVKRILKYLKKTRDLGLMYSAKGTSILEGYVDADWGGNSIDRRSYTGFCFTLSGCIISWECKKQQTVALSSSEAEYMAMTEACKESIYLKNLQYEITKTMYSINLYNDNQSAQKLAYNPVFHKRTKHIDIKYHFCRDCVASKVVNLMYMSTAEMPADLLTKALCTVKHYKFLSKLGIQNV